MSVIANAVAAAWARIAASMSVPPGGCTGGRRATRVVLNEGMKKKGGLNPPPSDYRPPPPSALKPTANTGQLVSAGCRGPVSKSQSWR